MLEASLAGTPGFGIITIIPALSVGGQHPVRRQAFTKEPFTARFDGQIFLSVADLSDQSVDQYIFSFTGDNIFVICLCTAVKKRGKFAKGQPAQNLRFVFCICLLCRNSVDQCNK